MKKVIILFFLLMLVFSCKKKKKSNIGKKEISQIVDSSDMQNFKDCITIKDSISIKNAIKSLKKDLKKLTEKDLKLKYKLNKEVFHKDKIAIINAEEELYFEKVKDECLNLTVYFNYNFSKDNDDNSWKGEHQTIMKIEKVNKELIIKSIMHL